MHAMNCGKNQNENYRLKEKYLYLSRTTFLALDGSAHSPRGWGVWLLTESCHLRLSRGRANPQVMPPVEASSSRVTWLGRPRPGLLSGDFSAPKHSVGSAKDFTVMRLSASATPARPPPRTPRLFSVNFPHTRRHRRLCSPGTEICPRSSLRGSVLAPVFFGAQLF